jgi:selenocysteine-specific elongation factor
MDPDRLAEEKAREMTIDLGFAWLNLPNGETVGVVDVPGHRDFIENMLAGIGGIDAVLLVIAADEGVMPQTQEHLAILDLLGIQNGLIVLSKIDVVQDVDWLQLVEQEIRDLTRSTTLHDAEIIGVSSYTGAGIPSLLEKLSSLLAHLPERPDYNHPYLPIDRVFTISGFGTVVTGTLAGGTLHVGDEIEVQPAGLYGRIRGLQSYKQQVDMAQPGSRVAVNISGIDKKAIARGHVLTTPGQMLATQLVDVRFRHLPDAERPLKHNAQIRFFSGAAEASGHVRLLSDETVAPGAEGWLQIRLDEPIALAQGDRFILRSPSPAQTIGGGVVVDPHPARRWRRFQPEIIAQLETRMLGTPAQRIAQAAEQPEPIKRPALQKLVGYGNRELDDAIRTALAEGLLLEFPDRTFWATSSFRRALRQMTDVLSAFHSTEPLRLGMPREELRSRVGLKGAVLSAILSMQNEIIADDNLLRLATHRIHFNEEQQARIVQLRAVMAAVPYTPPSYEEAAQIVGADVLWALIELGEIVQVQPDVIFAKSAYEEMVAGLLEMIDREGKVTAKAFRDRFDTSRKYAIGLLEYLDSIGITKRVGDERVRGRRT